MTIPQYNNTTTTTTGRHTPFSPIMVSTTPAQHPCQVSRTGWRWTTPPGVAGLRSPTRNVSPRADWQPTSPAAPPRWPCSASRGAAGGTARPAASRPASGPRTGERCWTRSYWTRWMPVKRISATFPTNFLFSNNFVCYLSFSVYCLQIYWYVINNSLLKSLWSHNDSMWQGRRDWIVTGFAGYIFGFFIWSECVSVTNGTDMRDCCCYRERCRVQL